jgi:transposase
LHTWRHQVLQGRLGAIQPASFVPIRLVETAASPAPISPPVGERMAAEAIEITLPDGSRLRVGNDVNVAALRRVMTVLRG